MQVDIRESIKSNFKNLDQAEIKKSIEDAISEHDEITLPGLGVFFEILWNHSNNDFKNKILENLEKNI